jgi:hypothetical protein
MLAEIRQMLNQIGGNILKQFNVSYIICSVILGLSIIVGFLIIRGDREQINENETKEIVNQYKPLMTIMETAKYLNLTEFQVRTIISTEEEILNNTHTYTGKMFPIIKISNEIYVSTNDLNEWLKDSTSQRKQY